MRAATKYSAVKPRYIKRAIDFMKVEIDICVYSIESCLNAESACASRAELCASPQEGGITPSISLISAARNLLNKTGLFVMIRPRGGDFLYTKEELEIMHNDAVAAVHAGADGIVIGLLKSDGSIDVENCRSIIRKASQEYATVHSKDKSSPSQNGSHIFKKTLGVTFHRAFDRADVFSTLPGNTLSNLKLQQRLAEIASTGAERVLTSGFLPTVNEGMANIAEIVSIASSQVPRQLKIMAGSGVNATNAKSLIESGVDALHLTAKSYKPGNMIHRALHFTEKEENELMFADSEKIEAIMQILLKHNNK